MMSFGIYLIQCVLLFIFVVVCWFVFCLFVVAVVCMFVCFVLVEGGGNYDGIVNHTLLIVKVYFLKDDIVVLKMIIICSQFVLNKF